MLLARYNKVQVRYHTHKVRYNTPKVNCLTTISLLDLAMELVKSDLNIQNILQLT